MNQADARARQLGGKCEIGVSFSVYFKRADFNEDAAIFGSLIPLQNPRRNQYTPVNPPRFGESVERGEEANRRAPYKGRSHGTGHLRSRAEGLYHKNGAATITFLCYNDFTVPIPRYGKVENKGDDT